MGCESFVGQKTLGVHKYKCSVPVLQLTNRISAVLIQQIRILEDVDLVGKLAVQHIVQLIIVNGRAKIGKLIESGLLDSGGGILRLLGHAEKAVLIYNGGDFRYTAHRLYNRFPSDFFDLTDHRQ